MIRIKHKGTEQVREIIQSIEVDFNESIETDPEIEVSKEGNHQLRSRHPE